jgi:hypothetical protein
MMADRTAAHQTLPSRDQAVRLQTEAKARLRDDALRDHLAQPIEERLRRAVALIIPRQTDRTDDRRV